MRVECKNFKRFPAPLKEKSKKKQPKGELYYPRPITSMFQNSRLADLLDSGPSNFQNMNISASETEF